MTRNTEPREPSRLPVRGSIATVGTVAGLALLLSFRGGPLAPGEPVLALGRESGVGEELGAEDVTETSGTAVTAEQVTVSGDLIPTRWGDVQVEVTLAGSDITEVAALVLPDGDRHSAGISQYVEPILREQAIDTDSADVSVISGATYTSEAYAESLQSALDQAAPATAVAPVVAEPDAVEPEVAAEAPTEVIVEEPATEPAADEIRTATGMAVSIRWGEVQVAVTVEGDDIIDVETLALPLGDRRSQRINGYVEPILREEAIDTDSADVSVISGATYTSEAYAASLQSALDQLGI